MHELGFARNIVAIVGEHAAGRPVRRVRLTIGPLAFASISSPMVLAKNDRIAARNRGWFEGRGVLALNFVSSPGAGKTSLLEALVRKLAGSVAIAVIEGDQMTSRDAERIRAAGARAVQINTGAGCHLEADMVARAVAALDPEPGSWLLIENVGNLVCPAMFDLGERMKVAVISTPEGEDKPLKYPHMFQAAELCSSTRSTWRRMSASTRRSAAPTSPRSTRAPGS